MPKKEQEQLPEDLQKSLIEIFKLYDKEDSEIRKSQIRTWKKHEEYWSGVQYLFWNATTESWNSPATAGFDSDFADEELAEIGSFYDYVVNIFRGHGEAIIAALSAQIPTLRFVPDDADDSDDVLTAQTYDKIADLIQRHNKVKLMALRAFFFFYLNGICASYIYKESDFKYGSFTIPEFDAQEVDTWNCPDCETEIYSNALDEEEQNKDAQPKPDKMLCSTCNEDVKPKKGKKEIPIQAAPKVLPKTRVKIDLFGGLQVKVPIHARNQDECPYLILYSDVPKEVAIENYPECEEDIINEHVDGMDRFPRTDFTYPSDPEIDQKNLVTIYKIWMRPCAFNREVDKGKRKRLQEEFPKGVRLEIIGKQKKFGAASEEELDKRWRIGQAGLSTFIHSDAMCTPLVSIQEMRNTLVNLTMETIEHGIPSTFADPRVLNFDEYAKYEAEPGMVYKTLPGKPGQPIAAGFYETSRATLSKEVPGFTRQLDQDAQFATGAFPSVVGAPANRDRSTAKEYEMSRQIALQRLQIAWQLFVDWFRDTIENSVRLYVETVVEDEKFTKKDDSGQYVNIWIRQAELTGNVGGCESEADSSFPTSLAQQKGIIMELMQLNNPFINAALYTPENAHEIQDVLALNQLKLPGEAQRVKQILEIRELTRNGAQAEEVGVNPLDSQKVFNSSVPIEPEIDDDAVHAETCRAYLVDMTGIDLKRTNPAGYMNVFYHMKAHLANIAVTTAGANATPPGIPPKTTQFGPEQ